MERASQRAADAIGAPAGSPATAATAARKRRPTENGFLPHCVRFRTRRGPVSPATVLAYPDRVQRGGSRGVNSSVSKPSDGTFDDHATRVMGEAFDAARIKLHSSGQPQIVFETIAARIIAAASKGERDPVRLRRTPGWPDWHKTAIRRLSWAWPSFVSIATSPVAQSGPASALG